MEIKPDGVYDDGALVLELGLTHAALARARREGKLRWVRVGKRVVYRGEWLLEWLEREGEKPQATVGGRA